MTLMPLIGVVMLTVTVVSRNLLDTIRCCFVDACSFKLHYVFKIVEF